MTQISPSLPPARDSSTSWLYLFRLVLLLLCSILNAAALGVIVREIIVDDNVGEINIIGVTSGVLTLVLIPGMLLVSRIRENASFVYILTEVVILGVLGILWTITAALIIQDFNFWGCDGIYLSDKFDICEQLSAKKGLTVATFVLLLFYVLTLIIYAVIRAFTVESSVWFQPVKEQRLRPPNVSGSAAHATKNSAAVLPSIWGQKSTDEVRYKIAAAPIAEGFPGHTFQAPPGATPFGVITYPPTTLSQAVSMHMAAENPVEPTKSALDTVASSTTNLTSGAGTEPAQVHPFPAPQQVNIRIISRSSPQQQVTGLQNIIGYQGAPVTPPYPQA